MKTCEKDEKEKTSKGEGLLDFQHLAASEAFIEEGHTLAFFHTCFDVLQGDAKIRHDECLFPFWGGVFRVSECPCSKS